MSNYKQGTMVPAIKGRIKQKSHYLAFIIAFIALLAYVYSLTFNYRNEETVILPRLVIYASFVAILVDLLITLFPELLPDSLVSESSSISGFENRNIRGIDVLKQFGWVFAFLASLQYIGFFTTTAAFSLLYIYVNDTESSTRSRVVAAVVWTLFINGFLWVLFIELLQVSSVFDLGFLP